MNRNINILDKSNCTGCGLCRNICPQSAIKMLEDKEGFLTPIVMEDKCNFCGLCAKSCPQLDRKTIFHSIESCYAFVGDNNLRFRSSSGGAFGTIALMAIEQGGTAYGAAFDSDFRGVSHIRASDEKELNLLLKSKYVQSDTGLVYQEVKKDLESSNNPVVFCGCPCQVNALKIYLRKDYDNLITIDLLCHGIVSPLAYRKFLDDFLGDVDSPIVDFDFRCKESGWASKIKAVAQDGTVRVHGPKEEYFNAFLWGYSQRKVCFSCQYAKSERVGDISLGDFWGINDVLPSVNDGKGTSLILCNTPKGKTIIQTLSNKSDNIVRCDVSKVLQVSNNVNWAIIKPGIMPYNRDAFFYRLSMGSTFLQAFNYASTGEYDVGIFGWWFEDEWTNFGSTLTYYALMEYVSSLGLTVCMLTSPHHTKDMASSFMRKHGYVISETFDFRNLHLHNKRVNTFLLGSDQLWFYHCYKSWGYSLFLDFAADEKKKIAYATSFGHANPQIPQLDIPILNALLHRFDAISVREEEGKNILSKMFNINAVQNLDPVFLCDTKVWDIIANEAEHKTKNDFLFAYILDPNEEKVDSLKFCADKLNLPIVSITDKQYQKKEKEEVLKDYGIITDSTIESLIYNIKNAKFVITDSFHGTCFALIFHKPFITIINKKRGISRFETLSSLFDVGDRFVDNPKDILNGELFLSRPDYFKIIPKIEKEIKKSQAWLCNELFKFKS